MKHKRGTKLLSILLSLVLMLGLLPTMALTASAQLEPVSYKAATVDPTTHAVTFSEMESEEYTVITDSSEAVAWDAGWYVVKGADVKISGAITANGNVNLILCDGAKLTVTGSINVSSGYSLAIYGQSAGTGTLKVTNISTARGALTINGGAVIAESGDEAIATHGTLTINGGSVSSVVSAEGGYAIVSYTADTIINGGRVSATATGNGNSTGIIANNGSQLYIYGGNVTAVGKGRGLIGSNVTINGGNIEASGSQAIYLSYFSSYNGSVTVGPGLLVMAGDSKETAVDATEAFSVKSTQHTEKWVQIIPTIPYQEASWNSETHEVEYTAKSVASYTEVTASDTAWGKAGNETWYIVNSTLTNSNRITVSGTVNLILCDGAKLTASAGITVKPGNSLAIYGQSEGSGELIATGGAIAQAGIGGVKSACGSVTINGGIISATGNSWSAGIGGAGESGNTSQATGGTIIINGGRVTAQGGNDGGSGIGGGQKSAGGNTTINGGTVNATGGPLGAGIGGGGGGFYSGSGGSGGNIVINGGAVTANGGNDYGAGIGGGLGGHGGTIKITGGTVAANGASYAAGIGGGYYGKGGDVTVTGGTVTTYGGSYRGIGSGYYGDTNGTLTLGSGMYLYWNSVTPDNAVKKSADGDYERSATMIVNNVSPHTHSLTYSYSETAVTAVCNGDKLDFCDYPLVDGKPAATLTIAAPEKGGDPATADISASGIFDETKISAISYETRQPDGTFAASEATPPTADGFHKASLTYTDDQGEHTISVTYGLNCITYGAAENGTIDGAKNAAVGAVITPTITPATGYELDTLTVIKTGTTEEVTVTNNESFIMPDYDVTVDATFKLADYTITTSATNGTVTAKKGETAATTANYQDTITLSNEPAEGYQFSAYTVTKTGDSSTTVTVTNGTFTMPAYPVTVTATFTPIDYTVTVTQPEADGTIGASKTTANIGNEITLSATPAEGYELDAFTVTKAGGGTVTVTDNKFTMPASDVTATAAFKPADYHVTITSPIVNGSVTASIGEYAVTADTNVHYQDEITLTVTPDAGYGLKSITTTSGTLVQTALDPDTGVLTYALTMGAGDATVTAEFSKLTVYTIFYNAGGKPDAVSIKPTGGDGDGYPMTSSAKLGNIDCWSTQVLSGDGLESLSYAFKAGNGEWTTLNIPVVSEVPNTLDAGKAVAIEGEANAFVVAFAWGEGENDNRYYLVTSNTASVDVPNPANTDSETFTGWTYLVPSAQAGGEAEEVTVNKADGNATTVQLNKITQTTIASAIWTPKSFSVRIDPDNGSTATTQSVTYGAKVTKPDTPTKAGYEFAGWVLAKDAVEKIGDKTLQFSAGTAFDFDNTGIINDLYLKAKWKHVHAYACLQLDDSVFGDAFKDYYGYKGQLHIKLCTSMDDYSVEAHNFVNGKCACGWSITDDKVKLTEHVGDETSEINAVKDSIVSIIAPQNLGSQRFGKWQYSADGQNWRDLTAMRGVAFSIPADMSVKAVYESEPFKLSINSFKYGDKYIAFQFDYSVPDGFTVVDGGLMIGDNVRMKFWDCTIKSFLGNQYEPSLRDAVSVYGGGTIANKMVNYQTINEPGLATPIKKPLATFGKTGTTALAWQPYDLSGYNKAINAHGTVKNYNQQTYPTYAMGYIICKTSQGGYVGFMTNAISATLESPAHSHVTTIPVS